MPPARAATPGQPACRASGGRELLVSYPWGRFRQARGEIVQRLREFGDERPVVGRTCVEGIARVRTVLDGRAVVRRCHERFSGDPLAFAFAIQWVPVDSWCETDLEAIRRLIEEEIRDRIGEHETWGMKVEKRRWQQYHTAEIVARLAPAIDRPVNLDDPDKWLRIDVVGAQTAVSLLGRGEIFSSHAPAASQPSHPSEEASA